MNFAAVDWVIVVAVYAILVAGMLFSKRYMRSVADFLAAGRTAGRYLLSVSMAIAGVGAITIVGNLQMNFEAGFAMSWWGQSMGVVLLVLAVSGWVIYRFRSTRSMTLSEFFERRYSRKFRIASGAVCFFSGLINFGIFPSVGARFFIYFVGLPESFDLLGMTIDTFPVTMLVLLATSLWFVFSGGQVSVIFTDFLQGLFANVVFIVIPVYLLFVVGWDRMTDVLTDAPAGKSLIDPFDTGNIPDFNFGYFLIGVFGILLRGLGWQGEQAYHVSAKSAHEAKMGGVLSLWRALPMGMMMLLVPILAAVVMQHPDFTGTATSVTDQLGMIEAEAVRTQLQTPLVLTHLLPAGLMGMLCAMMLAAFISTHDTYLHSWGSIFIQDVVMPFRKKPLDTKTHLLVLRCSYVGVAIFAFIFSWLYIPSEAILLFFAATGAIFAGWAGIVTIGGLYTRWGGTGGAWAALVVGGGIPLYGVIMQKINPDLVPLNGQ
ncbi:MAG: sodium:solute symporter, partial [Planctomycetota bacterium]